MTRTQSRRQLRGWPLRAAMECRWKQNGRPPAHRAAETSRPLPTRKPNQRADGSKRELFRQRFAEWSSWDLPDAFQNHVQAKDGDQYRDTVTERTFRHSTQQTDTAKISRQNPDDGDRHQQPFRSNARPLRGEIDGHPCTIDQQCHRRCRGDIGFLRDGKSQKGGRANASLVSDEATKEARTCSRNPSRTPSEAHSVSQTRQAGNTREQ